MSTTHICSIFKAQSTSRVLARYTALGLCALSVIAAAVPAAAQRTTFDPHMSLSYLYNSNVNYTGSLQASDSSARFWVTLPAERELKTGKLQFSYTGYAERFDKFEGFDDIGHQLRFSIDTKPSQRSGVSFRVGYQRTQDQGGSLIEVENEDADPTFTRRLLRQSLGAVLSFERQFSRRTYGKVWLGAQGWTYDNVVEDSEGGGLPETFEDRTEGRLFFQLERQVSEKTRVGGRVGFQRFDLDLTGLSDAISASFVVNRAFKDQVRMSLELGGFQNQKEIEETGETLDRSGFRGSFRLDKSFRTRHLGVFAAHRLSAGGARLGTSTNSDVRIYLNDTSSRRWGWGVFARYGRRDPDDPQGVIDDPFIDTVEGGARIQIGITRTLGLGFLGTYADQIRETSETSRDFYRLAAFITWYPKGWKDLSVGSGF